jgi:hypothetical protein
MTNLQANLFEGPFAVFLQFESNGYYALLIVTLANPYTRFQLPALLNPTSRTSTSSWFLPPLVPDLALESTRSASLLNLKHTWRGMTTTTL